MSNIFLDMSRSWSSDKMQREEDQLTAAFLTTLRLCPRFSRTLLKKFLGRSFDTSNMSFEFQVFENNTCKPDGVIQFNNSKVVIENKFGAPLSKDQIDKYRNIARESKGNIIWFIYPALPPELEGIRFNHKKTKWKDIHHFLHLFLMSKKISQYEEGILKEFKTYLEVKGVTSFVGFKKDDGKIWVRAAGVRDQMRSYLTDFSSNEKRIEAILGNYDTSNVRSEDDGQLVYLSIWKRKRAKGLLWKNKCRVYLGFRDDPPAAYIYAEIDVHEWDRVSRLKERKDYGSCTRGLRIGGFTPYEKGSRWAGFSSAFPLDNITGKRNQTKILDRFFFRGLAVLEKNVFHLIETWRR